jgi:anti-anti-sigma factor
MALRLANSKYHKNLTPPGFVARPLVSQFSRKVDSSGVSPFDSTKDFRIPQDATDMAKSDIDVLTQNSVTVVVLGSEYDNLDEVQLEATSARLLQISQEINPPLMLVDMSRTQFFGSAFLGALFRVWNRLKARGGKLAISHATGICADVLHVTHVHKLWQMYDSNDEAVDSLLATKS